ncbi:hypothetical protein ABZP36_007867 [Zizania latifolia]
MYVHNMDPSSGDWVLYQDDLDKPSFLGYFPKELIPTLNGGAPQLGWSGFVSYPKNEQAPPMGIGHFPIEGERKAAYFKNIKLFDSKADANDPNQTIVVYPYITKPYCYNVSQITYAFLLLLLNLSPPPHIAYGTWSHCVSHPTRRPSAQPAAAARLLPLRRRRSPPASTPPPHSSQPRIACAPPASS